MKGDPVRVGLKYCGGCQARYDRMAALGRIKEQCSPETVFEPIREGVRYDYILVINGCQSQCADQTHLLSENGIFSVFQWSNPLDAAAVINQIEEQRKEWNDVSTVPNIPFEIGDNAVIAKTITETDVILYAGISGDFSPPHVNRDYMSKTELKHCVAHGILTMAVSAATEYIFLSYGSKAKVLADSGLTYLSYGYDKVRFIKPVFFGDTITATYEIIAVDNEKMRTTAKLSAINQRGELVFVSEHIMVYFPPGT